MVVKVGIDSRGRRYKTVNGKRAKVVEGGEPRPQHHGSLASPVRQAIRRALHGAKGGGGVTHAISRLLQSEFNNLMSTTAKTSVGRNGQLYAARYMLAALRQGQFHEPDKSDDEELKKYVHAGALDTGAFRHFLASKGVEVGDSGSKAQTVAEPADDDANILALCHENGITSGVLRSSLPMILGDR